MPPRKKLKITHAVRNGSVSSEDSGGGGAPAALPRTYQEAVQQLVEQVSAAIRHNCAMFKLDVASGAAADLKQSLAGRGQQDICEVVPLCEVTAAAVPGGSGEFQPRQYAEALQQAVRAHFSFVEQDRRLIWTGAGLPFDAEAATWVVYLFKYLSSPLRRSDGAATQPLSREVNRRRTVTATASSAAIEEELDKFKNSLDRAERELLSVSRSPDELRLPATPPVEVSLPEPPRRSLGTALDAVLPRVAAGRHSSTPRLPLPRKRARAPSREDGDSFMDTADDSFTSSALSDGDSILTSTSPRTPGTPSKGAALSDQEAAQLTDFFFRLNGSQSEQARVSLTCRYAKLRYGRDVSAGAVYRLVERSGRAPALPPAGLSEEQQRDAALQVFSELDRRQTEQSRVAYTLQYMRVQHACRITANALFGWLGQGAKKMAKARR